MIASLMEAASLTLYKFTEGKEDWEEYVYLRDCLEACVESEAVGETTREIVTRRIEEFDSRRG